jgi:hypothetical protein
LWANHGQNEATLWDIAVRIANIVIAEEAVTGVVDSTDQYVEIIQISADTRTQLLWNDGMYERYSADEKLTGLQLNHFGAFYKRSWRANDWMWGRLDAAGWLIHILLDPRRVVQLWPAGATAASAALEEAAATAIPQDATDELKALFASNSDPDVPLPPSLPRTALWLAEGLQARIAAEELPVVADQIGRDRALGAPSTPGADAFLKVVSEVGDGRQIDKVKSALRRCPVGSEHFVDEVGTDLFARTVAKAAATGAAVASTGIGDPPPVIKPVLNFVRAVTLMAYTMLSALRKGYLAVALAIAIAVAANTAGTVQNVAVLACAVVVVSLLAVGVRKQTLDPIKPVVAAVSIAGALFIVLAGAIPWAPLHNWPLDRLQDGVRFLQTHWYWWALVSGIALAWLVASMLSWTTKIHRPRTRKRLAKTASLPRLKP